MVCDKCGKQNLMHLENGKIWCSWCNDWAMAADRESVTEKAARISREEGWRHCAQCGQMFREAENHDAACSYHTGRLWDYDKYAEPGLGLPGAFWKCCGYVIGTERGLGPGCAVARHIEAAPDDPGPIKRDLEAYDRAMRESSAEISSD